MIKPEVLLPHSSSSFDHAASFLSIHIYMYVCIYIYIYTYACLHIYISHLHEDICCANAFTSVQIHFYSHDLHWQIKTSSPLAILYNDSSVLENHHLATTFTIMSRDHCNILKALDNEDRLVGFTPRGSR